MLAKFSMILCCLLAFSAGAATNARNVLHVTIGGLRSDKGQVLCFLYSSANGFPKNEGKAILHSRSPITNDQANCTFIGIQPGTYAVSVFHDENSNGRLDTNFLGIPREGVGASNNAKGHFGPPRFGDASFGYAGGSLDLKIVIAYL